MIEQYRYTSIECEECGGKVVEDVFKKELYCLDCGLIVISEIDENYYDSIY